MTARANEVKNGELWIRCPYCGDSPTSPWKAHLSVDLVSGLYHCHRCKAGGLLPPKARVGLMLYPEIIAPEKDLLDLSAVLPGPATTRKSLLERYHFTDHEGTLFDAFEIKNPKTQKRTGFHFRGTTSKVSITQGSGVGWPRKTKLVSSPMNPLYLVEGPYDVLYQREVCCFGLVSSRRILDQLVGQYVVLVPDGDVWETPMLLRSLLKILKNPPSKCTIIGVEYIHDGLDPDEVPREERSLYRSSEILAVLKEKGIKV